MKGTEKQIAWAEDIKATVVKTIETMIAMTANDPRANTDAARARIAKVTRALEAVKSCDKAHDLIEVYGDVTSRRSERENLGMVLAILRNRDHRQYDTKEQASLTGE